MISLVFFGVIALSLVIALTAGLRRRHGQVDEYLVGGRSFPPWLLYFLAVGEIYSIGTMIGLPSGLYAGGASYGVWFIGYILMAYPLGYFIAPLIWRAGVRYDAMTVPDVFGRHFRSRALEIITALALLIALVPWGQYQFIGLQVVLGALGLPLTPAMSVLLAGVIAFLYLVVSGVRSPAFVAILKDALMLAGILIVGLVAATTAGGLDQTFSAGHIPDSMTTLVGNQLTFTLSTIVFQSITFYLGFSAAFVFTSKSERGIKTSTIWMPMYMLMYPFLVIASFYALGTRPGLDKPNTIFMQVTKDLLPDWAVGVVAAGAGLSGLLVLATTALTIGGIVTRNLVPNVARSSQKRVANLVVAVFLVAAALLTLTGSTLMLVILNLTYYLLGQLVPGWVALMFFRRVKAWALGVGIIAGLGLSVLFFLTKPTFAGINPGVVAVLVNAALAFGLSAIGPRAETEPMAGWAVQRGWRRAAAATRAAAESAP